VVLYFWLNQEGGKSGMILQCLWPEEMVIVAVLGVGTLGGKIISNKTHHFYHEKC